MLDTHYVIVVHGTWSKPDPEAPKWHQLNESDPTNFCKRLNDALERRACGRPIGRTLGEKTIEYSWSGLNKHEDRMAAGDSLAKLIREIETQDPSARIHLVAHSHGGNVVLAAVDQYMQHLWDTGKAIYKKPRSTTGWKLSENPELKAIKQVLPANLADRPQNEIRLDRLSEHWMTSTNTNRLGRMVFMGTPFLWKYWIHNNRWWRPLSIISSVIDSIYAVALSALVILVLSEMLTLLLWIFNSALRWIDPWLIGMGITVFVALWAAITNPYQEPAEPGPKFLHRLEQFVGFWLLAFIAMAIGGPIIYYFSPEFFQFDAGYVLVLNPLDWRRWEQLFAVVLVGVLAILAVMAYWKRDNRNVYFRPRQHKFVGGGDRALPYHSLILHAGYLDEALLGLASEPLVFGALVPQVHALLSPPAKFRVEKLPLGRRFSPSNLLLRVINSILRVLFIGFGKMFAPMIALWERRIARRLLQIVSSPAFGISAREFSGAAIVPRHDIGLPNVFYEREWDLTREMVKSPLQLTASDDAECRRYQFLWDPKEYEERTKESWLWKQLQPSLPEIQRRYQQFPEVADDFKRRLLTTSLALEERIMEFVGAAGIVHSAYYTNRDVIEGIADFISAYRSK